MFKKSVALIIAFAVMLVSLPMTIFASAQTPKLPDALANIEAGSTIYELDLSSLEVDQVPSGWIYGGAQIGLNFGWSGGNGSTRVKVENFQGTKTLHFGSSNCDALMLSPNITPTNYIYEVTFVATNGTANVGISNLSWGDTISDVKSAYWFVGKPSTYISHKGKGLAAVGSDTVENKLTEQGDSISANTDVTFKIVSLDGVNYYFINDVFYGQVEQKSSYVNAGNGTGGRLGLYTYGGDMYVKSFNVKNVVKKSSGSAVEVPDELANRGITVGESLLSQDFTQAEVNSGLPSGWYALLGGTGNNALVGWGNAGGYGAVVETKNSANMLHFTSWNCDSFLLTPKFEASNYVYEAVIVPNGTEFVGLANNAYGNDNTDIKDIQWFAFDDSNLSYWKSYNDWQQKAGGSTAGSSNDLHYTKNTEYKLRIYSYDGINYYYVNDTFMYYAVQSNSNTDEAFDRVGFYGYGADFYIKSVNVNALDTEVIPDGVIKVGNQYVMLGSSIYESDFTNVAEGTLPDGWSAGVPYGQGNNKTSFGWGLNAESGNSLVAKVVNHATLGKVVQFGSGATDAYIAAPSTGTMNYIYEAEVVINTSGGNSIGPANNFYAPTYEANGVFYNSVYGDNKTPAKYQYRNGGTGADWSPNFYYTSGATVNLRIVSYNGFNYVYYDNILVATAPWRSGGDTATSDNPGFYTYNGGLYIKSVKVNAIKTVNLKLDTCRVVVNDDESVDFQFDASFDKSQEIFAEYFSGDYTTDNSDFQLGAVVVIADENVVSNIDVNTDGADAVVFSDDVITQTADMINISYNFDAPKEMWNKWVNVRPYVIVDGVSFYGNGAAYTVANLANGAYMSATSDEEKTLIDKVFKNEAAFVVGSGSKELTFTVFADFHYKAGMYSTSITDLKEILKRADDTNSAFIVSAGDMSNDFKGSPELVNAFLGYLTDEGELLKAYNVYGNHELESGGNSMQVVTPTLTNDPNAVWGDGSVGDDPSDLTYGYYYVDVNGFRIVCVDNQYSWNPNHINGVEVGWEHSLTGSYGAPLAAHNASRGYDEGANAVGNTKTGSLGPVQMAWLEDVLLDAAANDIPCIVVGHAGYSGLGFGGGSSDANEVRAVYKKANDANSGTVLMSINGHIHTNNQGWNEGVFYFDVNTVRNNWWQSAGSNHYGAEHTYLYEEYDAQGNLISITEKSLNTLSMASQTWFSEDPLSAVVTINDAGVVSIDGSESRWAYGIEPTGSSKPAGTECRITSGLFWNCDLYGHVEKYVPNNKTRSAGTHSIQCIAEGCDYVSSPEEHTFDQQVVNDDYIAGERDCDSPASYYMSCLCGEKGTTTFTSGTAAGHDKSTAWTSNDAGHWHACANCTEKVDYAAHTFDQQVEEDQYNAGNANCNDPAKFYYSCVCGAAGTTTFESGTSMGHSPKPEWKFDGNTHWNECNNCTEKLNEAAHNFNQQVVNDAYKASDADCVNAATYYYSCVCGKAGTATFANGEADGHSPKTEWKSDTDKHWRECNNCTEKLGEAAHNGGEATCSEQAACDVCGVSYGTLDADNHNLEEVPEGEASHDVDGNIAHFKCNDCNKLFDDANATNELAPEDVVVDGGDHDFGEDYASDKDGHWQECDCGGKTDKADHTFGEWEVTSEATEATPGTKVRECSVCGFEEEGIIPATGDDSPETGDTSNVMVWVITLILSAAALSTIVIYRKRRTAR